MTRPHLIYVPYDSGRRAERMGKGPLAIQQALAENAALRLTAETIEVGPDCWREIESSFALMVKVAACVAQARKAEKLPAVISGNCCMTVGAYAGTDSSVLWLDGHSDFETPETSTSGFLDGMGAAMLLGRCWSAMTRTVPGLAPLPAERFIQIGVRDFMSEESRRALMASGAKIVPPQHCTPERVNEISTLIRDHVSSGIHIHLDLDVHDPAAFMANEYQEPNGLLPDFTIALLSRLKNAGLMRGLAITAYDPAQDPEGRVLAYVNTLLHALFAEKGARTVTERCEMISKKRGR